MKKNEEKHLRKLNLFDKAAWNFPNPEFPLQKKKGKCNQKKNKKAENYYFWVRSYNKVKMTVVIYNQFKL